MSSKNKKIALTITANTAQLRRDMRKAGAEVKTFERQVTGLGTKLRNMRIRFQRAGVFGRGGGMLRTAAGFAGAAGFHQMIAGAKDMDASLTDIAITGKLSGDQLIKLKKLMFDVSNATGKSTTEVLSFVSAMTTATGDTAAAMVALKDIGDVAVATGADMGSLGQVFVKLTTSLKVLPKEARQAFNILRGQEMVGAVTMAQLATTLPEVVGASGIMGKSATGLRGVAAIGGLMQMTRRGTGSVEEAKTASSKFLQDMYRGRKKLKKHTGIDIMGKDGNVRDLIDIFGELSLAMAKPGMLGKVLEKGIFNVRSIKTATELAKAGQVGLGGKQGTLESFKAVFGAGKIDEIAAGKKKREASASFQYERQITILSNTFKKHMLPLFGQLASTLKDVGPDLIRALKFMLENSRNLFKLWAGYKGVTFFKNLMAPLNGGAQGQIGGIPGLGAGGGAGGAGGGGWVMGPGGQMIPANAGSSAGAFGRGYGFAAGGAGTGGWIRSGRGGGAYYSSSAYAGGAFAGMGGPRVGAGGAWGVRGGGSGRGRFGRAYGRAYNAVGGFAGRYGGSMARGGGMIAGGAGMMGIGPNIGPEWANMASNMGLMSGNPYAMAAAGTYKAKQASRQYGLESALFRDSGTGSTAQRVGMAALSLGGTEAYRAIAKPNEQKFGISLDGVTKSAMALAAMFEQVARDAPKTINAYYKGSWRGFEQAKRQDALMTKHGFGGETEYQRSGLFGVSSHYGMSAKGKVALASKLGEGGLKALSGRLGSEKAQARAVIVAAMKKNKYSGEINEESIAAHDSTGRYSKLKDFESVVNKLIMVFQKGLRVNVNTVSGITPGQRVEYNSSGPVDEDSGPSAASIYRNPNP